MYGQTYQMVYYTILDIVVEFQLPLAVLIYTNTR